MNLDNISNGMIVKNYNSMCEILEEEIRKSGKGRMLQIAEWERYFDFDKDGHKFIIKEIYEIPMPKDFYENDIYSKSVNLLLLNLLKENGSGDFTMTRLLKVCGFVNSKWENMSLLEEYAKRKGITYKQAEYYYNQLYRHVYTYCTKALTRCLNRLKQRGFLHWSQRIWIQENGESRLATKTEAETYLDIVMKVREKLGIKYINLYNREEYFKALDNELLEHGWEKAFKLFQIIYAPSYIDKFINAAEKDLRNAVLDVNGHCLDQMYKYIDIDIKNDIKKLAQKINDDIVMAEICYDTEGAKAKKTDITNMYIKV